MFWESDGMLLINGKIITMENAIIESGFIQIENGKITAVFNDSEKIILSKEI